MTSTPLVAVAVVVAAAPFFVQGASGGPALITERSFMQRQASGVSFQGSLSDSRIEPQTAADSGDPSSASVDTGTIVYYRGSVVGGLSDGLAAWHNPTRTWRVYGMSALARSAGWYDSAERLRDISDDITGLAGTRTRVWMGTNGLGIIMLDVATERWSRYDVSTAPRPESISFVHFADDAYVFGWGGGRATRTAGDGASSSAPGLEVFSIRHAVWMRIPAVPRSNVQSLANNHGLAVAMSCSQEPYSQSAHVPLRECGMNHPDRVSTTDDGTGYLFEREFPSPGVTGRFVIRRTQLDEAFSRNQGQR